MDVLSLIPILDPDTPPSFSALEMNQLRIAIESKLMGLEMTSPCTNLPLSLPFPGYAVDILIKIE